jgi:ComF family protein
MGGFGLAVNRRGPKPTAMHVAATWARTALRPILDFALPARCPGCGIVTEALHRFCLDCWSSLVFLGPPCCARCALPFDYGEDADVECGRCLAEPPAFDRLRAAVAYGEISRKVALKLKYGGRPGVAETMARFMARHLDGADDAVLAPVPLHRWRIWRRGYNQSALIAAALARRSGLAARLDLVSRVKATPPLRGMNARQRMLAVRGAFRIEARRKADLKGRAVILVDDVYTSGATANACARVLRRAGAARVEILCWARVVRNEGAS